MSKLRQPQSSPHPTITMDGRTRHTLQYHMDFRLQQLQQQQQQLF